MAANRYLTDAGGADLSGRGLATLHTFGPLGVCLVAGVLAGALSSELPDVAILLGVVAACAFVAWPILLWMWLLRGARDLEAATRALLWDQGGSPVAGCQRVLRRVFRSDQRCRALHLLGLHAERSGDFAEAVELFGRAEASLPMMGAARAQKYARLVIGAHRAFNLVASGQAEAAHATLQQVSSTFFAPVVPGAFDAFTDDSSWGMGALSLNETLLSLEGKRDPRALISLAWALHHFARGAREDALRVLVTERPVLDAGLSPREHALARRLYAELEGGATTGPLPDDPWTRAVLAAAGRRAELTAPPRA